MSVGTPFADNAGADGYASNQWQCKLTSQHELAIWQPAWPTVIIQVSIESNKADETDQGAVWRESSRAPGSVDIPFKLMTSRIVDDLVPDKRCDKKEIEKQGGDGWSAWSSRNGCWSKVKERCEVKKLDRAAFCLCLCYKQVGAPLEPWQAPSSPDHQQGSPTCTPDNNLCIIAGGHIIPEASFLRSAADLCIWTNVPITTPKQICSPAVSNLSIMLFLPILLHACFLAVPAIANVEKTIFTAPDSINFGDARPNLMDLRLDILSSKRLSTRTVLPVIFPTEKQPRGLSSWYTLDSLRPGQRYEVRICWAATVYQTVWHSSDTALLTHSTATH